MLASIKLMFATVLLYSSITNCSFEIEIVKNTDENIISHGINHTPNLNIQNLIPLNVLNEIENEMILGK
jgi:hypothetical protein